MRKPRVLLVNEFSVLATGYSNYGLQVMQRLHATGKYELAELAIYGTPDDPRRHEIPWKYFPNVPTDSARRADYESRIANEWGDFTFNDVCLQFHPDIVFDIRDPWVFEFEGRSPFRRFFHWCIMPTVDAMPQQEAWLSTFMDADAVLTYTDWGRGVLDREGGGLIHTRGVAPPAADTVTFTPMDRAAIRRQFHMDEEVNVIGTVMRNQPRKLYPQLIRDFATFIREAPEEMARKTFLYLHVSYPDKDGWDIPNLIKQSGVSHKILVTYKCQLCHAIFPAFFQDARGACFKCGSANATLPNVGNGVDRRSLAQIINTFDVYIQYANSEGYGIPMVEAAACGVPVMATDYSAMSDVVRKLRGTPIPVASLDVEPYSGCLRARPDGAAFVQRLISYFNKPVSLRKKDAVAARRAAEAVYDWDRTTAVWMDVFDSLPLRDHESTWGSAPRTHRPKPAPAQMPSNEAYVEWAITNVLGRPDLVDSYMALRMIRDLNWGSTHHGMGTSYMNEDSHAGGRPRLRPFHTEDAYRELHMLCEHTNLWEQKRAATPRPVDF